MRRRTAARLGLGWLLAFGLARPLLAKTPGEVEVGQVLRDATMLGLNGPARKLSAYRGKPLIINVWASWCGPCRAEMASLERLAWGDLSARFTVIGISTDDHAQAARALLQRSNATINHFIDRGLELEHLLGATHLPLTVLVDAQGRVLAKIGGAQEWDGPRARATIEEVFGFGGHAAGTRTPQPARSGR
jgi:thiol-disulfide isomerase/thioredoxin